MVKTVSDQLNQFRDTVLAHENKLHYAELKIRVLEERLQRIAKYGAGSEKLSDEQLDLLELEIWRLSFERQRDFNPPEQRAAQHALSGFRRIGQPLRRRI